MTTVLETALWPLLAPMRELFLLYAELCSSYGAAVLLLGVSTAAVAYPLRRYGKSVESRLAAKTSKIKAEVKELDDSLSGEDRFWATDEIYRRYNFHPAHNMLAGASFLLQVPILIAAFLLLSGDALPAETAFGFIVDLSRPDGMLPVGGVNINILPAVMLMLSLADTKFFYADNPEAGGKLALIPLLICVLVYNLSAALIIYWMSMMLAAAVLHAIARHAGAAKPRA